MLAHPSAKHAQQASSERLSTYERRLETEVDGRKLEPTVFVSYIYLGQMSLLRFSLLVVLRTVRDTADDLKQAFYFMQILVNDFYPRFMPDLILQI